MTTHVAHRALVPADPSHSTRVSAHAATRRHALRDARLEHRYRRPLLTYLWNGNLLTLLIAPVIYSLVVPMALVDAWVTLYQWICFPALGIARVRRRDYFVLDRHTLAYLNALEKVNCTFCSYANGVLGYVREIQARTEQYWCPIKHANAVPHPHRRYHRFFAFGDAATYRRDLPAMRQQLNPARRSPR